MSSQSDDSNDGVTPRLPSLLDRRRRRMIAALNDADVPLSLADLARELARREQADGAGDLDDETVRTIYLQLYHRDVPKLADAGLLSFDTDRNTVALTDAPVDIDAVVELLAESDR